MLAADPLLVVGDNEPYDGALRGDTMYKHAIVNGFAHALIEIRQDLIADEAGAEAWAERLAPIVDAINRRPDIHEVQHIRLAHRARSSDIRSISMTDLSETEQRDFEAAAFRRLVEHLRERSDVQNIDLMNLAGFCRNCLSNWYRDAAEARGRRPLQGRVARDRLRHALCRVAGASTRPRHRPRRRRHSRQSRPKDH